MQIRVPWEALCAIAILVGANLARLTRGHIGAPIVAIGAGGAGAEIVEGGGQALEAGRAVAAVLDAQR
jgi:hypothetical protein